MKGYQRPKDLTGPGGVMEQLTKRLRERVLGAEMTHYLGYEKGTHLRSKPTRSAKTILMEKSKRTLVRGEE
jgi:putative transposase